MYSKFVQRRTNNPCAPFPWCLHWWKITHTYWLVSLLLSYKSEQNSTTTKRKYWSKGSLFLELPSSGCFENYTLLNKKASHKWFWNYFPMYSFWHSMLWLIVPMDFPPLGKKLHSNNYLIKICIIMITKFQENCCSNSITTYLRPISLYFLSDLIYFNSKEL